MSGHTEGHTPVFDNEDELPDDYPIYGDYLYIVDGEPYRSDFHDITARELRLRLKASKVCRCNMAARRTVLSRIGGEK
jgi:hypothetical protein